MVLWKVTNWSVMSHARLAFVLFKVGGWRGGVGGLCSGCKMTPRRINRRENKRDEDSKNTGGVVGRTVGETYKHGSLSFSVLLCKGFTAGHGNRHKGFQAKTPSVKGSMKNKQRRKRKEESSAGCHPKTSVRSCDCAKSRDVI